MKIQIKIKNIEQIRHAFRIAPEDMKRELGRAIQKATFQVGRQSRKNAPVDTGRLRASHVERFTPTKGTIEPTAYYAFFVHEGTRFMRGRPFLARAVESEAPQVEDFFAQAVQTVFDNIARRS